MFLLYVFRDIILIQLHFIYNTRWFNLWFIKECYHSLHNEHFSCFLRNPFWQYQTTELNNDTLITKTDRTYSNIFIYWTCIIYTYVFVQVQNVCQSSWNNLRKFIFSFDHMTSGFQCPSVYRQTRYTAKLPTVQKVAV